MSRIGKKPVPVPAGVTATIDGQTVVAKGPKGELSFVANDEVTVTLEDNAVVVTPVGKSKDARSKWGMSRTMVANILTGVKDGYERKLEINGVGYRAAMQGQNLQLALGFTVLLVLDTLHIDQPSVLPVLPLDLANIEVTFGNGRGEVATHRCKEKPKEQDEGARH